MWQVRHKTFGIFMGVSHGKGHYHIVSECCRSIGIYQFDSVEKIEELIRAASHERVPEDRRAKREDFTIEEWDLRIHDLLLDEGLIDDCDEFLRWSNSVFGTLHRVRLN